jgi:hypothetical protein
MKCFYLTLAALLISTFIKPVKAQTIIFDQGHFNIVNANGVSRLGAQITLNTYLNNINDRLSDLQINIGSVILVQNTILNSLRTVDQGLRTALAVKDISILVTEIITEGNGLIDLARNDPHLLLFAENTATQMKDRGINLVTEVSSFVLKEGENVLMDFGKRDALLKKIALELRLIRALIFSMKKQIYWVKIRGLFRSLNPYQGFINQDLRLGQDILNKSKLLKP